MNKHLIRIAVLLVISMLFFFGCDEVIDGDIVSEEDSTAAVLAAESANAALEEVMQGVFDADPDSAQDVLDILDFSDPNALYQEAHDLDPGNNDANFGLAFTGFLMLSQDTQLEEMLLRWESYFNVNEPFLVDDGSALGRMPLTVDGIRVPIATFIGTPLAMSKMSVDDVPQFSEFQALIDNLFLPVVEASIASLELIDDDPDYVFLISADMQGELEADPIELDLTEVYALEMGLYALKGVLKTVVAYDFDFASFDSAGIVDEMSQGSDFATLKSTGATDLGEALTSANTAFEKALLAFDFLIAETDDQSDDFIRYESDDDPADIRADIVEAQSALQGPTWIHYDYWEDSYDEDGYWIGEEWFEDSLEVDISEFFVDPITDFKAMLPPYTMGVQYYYDYTSVWGSEHIRFEETSVSIAGLDNTPISINCNYHTYDDDYTLYAWVTVGYLSYDLTTNPSDIPVAVMDFYAQYEAMIAQYTSAGYNRPYVSFSWSGTVTTGASLVIEGDIHFEYEEVGSTYVEPHPTWNATTYAEWLSGWPDPTMSGIFPGFDAADLAEFLGVDEYNWQIDEN